MLGFDAVGAYLLVVALVTLLVAVLVWQPYRNQRTIVVWLASGVVGVLLGVTGSYAGMRLAGYQMAEVLPFSPATNAAMSPMGGGPGGGCPMSGHTTSETGGMQGMPGMGESGCPMAKVHLTTLVEKLDLLTGITLSAEQAAAVSDCLKDVETPAKLTNSEAKDKYHRLLGVLNDKQKARLEAITLSQAAGSGGPGMGSAVPPMMGGGMSGGGMSGGGHGSSCPMSAGGHGSSCPMSAGGAASTQGDNQNPSLQDAQAKAFKSLRERLASKGPAPKAETLMAQTPKAPPAKTEPPKASPAKTDQPKSPTKKS